MAAPDWTDIAGTAAAGTQEHVTGSESRMRGGRRQWRALCSCGWTSTWQADETGQMADNAARAHASKAVR